MKTPLSLAFVLLLYALSSSVHAQTDMVAKHLAKYFVEGSPLRLPLWPDGAPDSNGIDYTTYRRHSDPARAQAIKQLFEPDPELFVYLPQDAPHPTKAVIACPGGAYISVVMHQEGLLWHDFFLGERIALIVLGYRLPHHHPQVPLNDVYQALRLVRQHAREWNIDPASIGVMGSSAGGHLASCAATHAPDSLRPAFQILFYPVISMDARYTHADSRRNLLGEQPTDEQVRYYSSHQQVTAQTPRALLLLAADDTTVTPLNALLYYQALLAAHVPAALHIYPSGGHGFGAMTSFPYHLELLQELRAWLRSF